jgi:hypothetical protein
MVKYVKEFEFAKGGQCYVKGYLRGGPVKPVRSPMRKSDMVVPIPTPSINRTEQVARTVSQSVPAKMDEPTFKKGGAVGPKGQAKVGVVMREFKKGDLHSGKGGSLVKNPKQAIAIALSEGRKVSKK